MKKILKTLVKIPNYPFYFCLATYIAVKIVKHTNPTELEIYKEENGTYGTPEIKEFISKVYPKWFRNLVAVVFYFILIAYFVMGYF